MPKPVVLMYVGTMLDDGRVGAIGDPIIVDGETFDIVNKPDKKTIPLSDSAFDAIRTKVRDAKQEINTNAAA